MPDENWGKNWFPLAILAAALVVWTGLLAVGAYFELGSDRPRHDLRKPLLILATLAFFLAVWGVALWNRGRRQRGK